MIKVQGSGVNPKAVRVVVAVMRRLQFYDSTSNGHRTASYHNRFDLDSIGDSTQFDSHSTAIRSQTTLERPSNRRRIVVVAIKVQCAIPHKSVQAGCSSPCPRSWIKGCTHK